MKNFSCGLLLVHLQKTGTYSEWISRFKNYFKEPKVGSIQFSMNSKKSWGSLNKYILYKIFFELTSFNDFLPLFITQIGLWKTNKF